MNLLRDESGQATVEYVLMLFVAVGAFLMLYTKLLSPVLTQFRTNLSQEIQSGLFGGDFHTLNLSH